MQKKLTAFETWVKEVSEPWKHINSLKGKQAKRNLGILKTLLESDHPLSMWELALEYLKITENNFSLLIPDTVYRKRQIENAQMSRRLKFLAEKKYVRKEGTQYRLSLKGTLLMFLLDATLAIERGHFHGDEEEKMMIEVVDSFIGHEKMSDPKFQTDLEKKWTKNPERVVAISTFFKLRFLKWKIDLDEISPENLLGFILTNNLVERWIDELQDIILKITDEAERQRMISHVESIKKWSNGYVPWAVIKQSLLNDI